MERRRRPRAAILAALSVTCLSCAAGCRRDHLPVHRQSRVLMGTLVEVTVVAGEDEAPAHLEAVFGELARLDEELGSHGQRGAVQEVNRRAWPGAVEVGEELFGLLTRAREVGKATGGTFDVTVGAVSRLWSFDGEGRIPGGEELASALAAVGWDGLRLDQADRRVTFTHPGMRIDLGGVAKGYAVDRARRLLEARGVPAGIVNAGGDLAAWGTRPADGRPWRVGIQDPRDPSRLLGTLSISGRAVVTSGDYERYFVRDGRRYHHVLDPSTGLPARGLASVTVVAERAEEADAWATALMVMGPERARVTLEGFPDLAGVLVGEGGDVYVSRGLADAWQAE